MAVTGDGTIQAKRRILFGLIFLPLIPAVLRAQSTDTPVPPEASEQARIISAFRKSAMRYQGHLPEFVCTQLTTRSVDSTGTGAHLKQQDVFEERIVFSDGHENYTLTSFNGKPTKKTHRSLGGISENGLLKGAIVPGYLFGARTPVSLEWSRWDVIGGKSAPVIAFRVAPSFATSPGGKTSYLLGFHGFAWVSAADNSLIRVEEHTDAPPGYPFPDTGQTIDYGFVNISGMQFLLPVKAVIFGRDHKSMWSNTMEFTDYGKFQTDASIRFEDSADGKSDAVPVVSQAAPPPLAQDSDLPELDVASIKLNRSGATEHTGEVLPSGVFFAENVTMSNMIQLAWRVQANAVIGSPDWFTTDHFDIDGKVPPNTPDDAVRLMLQRYLTSEFKLAVHLEQEPRDVFALVVSEAGPRLQKAAASGEADSDCAISVDNGQHRADCTNITVAGLAERLPELAPGYIDRPVIDLTGIAGTWNLRLEWVGVARIASGGLTIFDAIQKDLGLRLDRQNLLLPVVVIDHAERLAAK